MLVLEILYTLHTYFNVNNKDVLMAARQPFADTDTADEAVRATCDDATTCKRSI